VSASTTDEERREALACAARARAQVGRRRRRLAAFREAAKAALDAEEVLAQLDAALRARPDLWQAHHEKIEHLREIGRPEEAEQLARAALERFPHSAPLWIALARSLRLAGKPTEAAEALARGVELHPDATSVVRELGFLLDELDRTDEALTLIGDAIARTPTASELRACRAWILRRSGDARAAIEEVERLLRREPGSAWGWERLDDWCRAADAPTRAVEFAKVLTGERPASADAWIALANRLGRGEPSERHRRRRARRRARAALARGDRCVGLRACDAGRLDAAREACNGASFGGRAVAGTRARA
jgi:predicted Zn-dependent protease